MTTDFNMDEDILFPGDPTPSRAQMNGGAMGPLELVPLVGRDAKAIRWLWRGLIPLGGVSMLAGDGGHGKSLWTCLLASELSRGVLPGHLHGEPARVLIVSAEDTVDEVIVPRLKAAGSDLELIDALNLRSDKALVPDLIDELASLIERGRHRVLILDPLNAFLSGRLNTWNDSSIRTALRPLADLSERADCSVLTVIHLNKATSDDFRRRVNGSGGYLNAARAALLWGRHPDNEDVLVLAHGKHNWSRRQPSRLYELREALLEEIEGPPEDRIVPFLEFVGETTEIGTADILRCRDGEEQSDRERARDFLTAELIDGPVNVSEIKSAAKANGISERTLERAKADIGAEARRASPHPRSPWQWFLPVTKSEEKQAAKQAAKSETEWLV